MLHHAEARGVHDLLLSVVLEDVSSSMDDLIHSVSIITYMYMDLQSLNYTYRL